MKVAGFNKVQWMERGLVGEEPDGTVTLYFDEPPCAHPNAITGVVIGSTVHRATGYRKLSNGWHAIVLEWTAAGVDVGDEVTIQAAL